MTSRRGLAAWALYDWANTAFFTVIQTFVFAAYFTSAVAESETAGTTQWAVTVSAAGLVVALAGPALGAIADQGGRRKPWLAAFTALSVLATALLWTIAPSPAYVLPALVLFALATIGSEVATIFYNAMLPSLVPQERVGRMSGWGWAAGYVGGVLCLVLVLAAFVGLDQAGTDDTAASGVRRATLVVAGWYTVFALPLFILTPDRRRRGAPAARAVRQGLRTLGGTLRDAWRQRGLVRFLLAHMIYVDGLGTLFAFGGIYAAGTFGLAAGEVIVFGIMMTTVAGVGAAAFGWVDDRIGPKRALLIALAGLIVFGLPLLFIRSVALFWTLGAALAVFVGPVQSSSRSLMARIAPPDLQSQMFGLHALSGKASAFVGPALLGGITALSGNQRAGMATVFLFFAAGFVVLWPLPAPEEMRAAA